MKVKARMDGEYVKNLGLWMDLRCLALTIFAVLSMKGHREGGKATTTTQHNSSTNTNPVDQPLVSIIIPVYNAEKYIAEAIQSVINQTYTNWELLLVDDCSDDKSVDISKHYTNNDDRIKLLFLDTNSGPAIARNFGIDTARGRYIAFLDADDKWDKNKLSIQVQFMLDKGCAFSFTSYEFANAECIPNGKKVHVPKEITYEQALRNTPISTITVMLDISILSREDVAMPQVTTGEDTATWWKILKKVKLAYGIDCVLSYYRRSFHTLSSNKVLAMKRRWILYRELEKLSLAHSTYNFIHYCYYAAKRRV